MPLISENMGTRGTVDLREGKIVITKPYTFDTEEDAIFSGPLLYEGRYAQTGRSFQQTSPGKWEALIDFESEVLDSEFGEGLFLEWEIDAEFSEEPIEAHPNIEKILEVYNGYRDGENRVRFHPTLASPTATGKGGLSSGTSSASSNQRKKSSTPNPVAGLETFFVTGAICRTTRIVTTIPEQAFREVDRIIERPPVPMLAHVDFGSRNWLVMQPQAGSETARSARLVQEYKLSAPGGWPPYVHGIIDDR